MKKILAGGAVLMALAAAAGAMQAKDWGTGLKSFRSTCAAMGGVLNGKGYASTCSFDGGVVNVPAGSPGWTVDVAQGTVATWLGGAKVTEEPSGGTLVVACYDADRQPVKPSHEHCARPPSR